MDEKLPDINFISFIFSLNVSAMMHFGEIPDPVTNEKRMDVNLAKQTIDLLGMLKEKTKGNLAQEEESVIEEILYNLRLKYVQTIKK